MVSLGCLAAGAPPALAGHAATAQVSRNWPVLRQGSTGPHVLALQRVVGVNTDGVFGMRTKAAVQRYQERHRLSPDGVVGPRTAAVMRRSSAPVPTGPTKAVPRVVVSIAAAYTGIPYKRGGAGPTGFDCSGYTSFVYRRGGISIPRTAAAQQAAAQRVSNPRPGDLVFFGSPAYHVGIYAGHGYMFDAGRPGLHTQKRKVFRGVSGYGRPQADPR